MRKTVCLNCTMFCNPSCKCKYCKETQCFAISPDRCIFAYPRIVMSKTQYNAPVDGIYNLENVVIPAEHEEGNVDRYEGIKILYKRNGHTDETLS